MYEMEFQLASSRLASLCSFLSHQSSDGARVSVPSDKPVLLMLHGWQDNAASFTSLFDTLAIHYHVIAIDWPGHGLSAPRAADNYYHFVDYVDDLAQIIDFLALPQVSILGHSLGALVAVCYTAAFAERVQSLVLIEGLAPLAEPAANAPLRLRQGIIGRQRYRQHQYQRQTRSMASFRQALEIRCSVNGLSTAQLRPLVERGVYQQGERWYWRHDHRLRCESLYRMALEHSVAMRSAISCPVLSIVGRNGYPSLKLAPLERAQWQNIIQLEVDGGHHCHIDSPLVVAEQIMLFSSKIKILGE
ncbi:alpha/beta hydrolase [Photobacterium nomapromontoriensis]|uniref:alpha/beta hydrolase n=1 Tax=Photobacterium nomapromontoriensis TaxID=2910237 RepID=UPI003D0C7C9C